MTAFKPLSLAAGAALALLATTAALPAHAQAQTKETPMTATVTPAGDPDSARVISIVSSIPLAVDLARYDLAEAAFAPSIVIDYTSLWGGEPQRMTPAELIAGWRGLVPGFDATRHELKDVRAEIDGDRATATAFVDGRHWIESRLWRPIGTYRWTLERQGGAWKVTHMTFAMSQEIGDRGLVALATERAKGR